MERSKHGAGPKENDDSKPKHHNLVWADLNIAKFIFWSTTFNWVFEGGCNYPLDLVKTRLQVQSSAYASTFPKYGGVADALRTIVKQEGLRGLWKGFGVTSMGYLPTQAIFYGTYEFNKDRLSKLFERMHHKFYPGQELDRDKMNVFVAFLSGGFAELMAGFLWVPMDVVVQRLQIQGPSSQHHLYKGGFDAFNKIVRKEGVIGLYRGYAASMFSYIPAAAVSWATYEFMKQKLYNYNVDVWVRSVRVALFGPIKHQEAAESQSKESHIVNFLSGVTGGIFASVVANPMDVAKTRLQTDTYIRDATRAWEPPLHHHMHAPFPSSSSPSTSTSTSTSSSSHHSSLGPIERKYTGVLSALRLMVKEEGPAALMKGVLPRIMFYAPLAGMQYSIYELAKTLSQCTDEELKARGLDE